MHHANPLLFTPSYHLFLKTFNHLISFGFGSLVTTWECTVPALQTSKSTCCSYSFIIQSLVSCYLHQIPFHFIDYIPPLTKQLYIKLLFGLLHYSSRSSAVTASSGVLPVINLSQLIPSTRSNASSLG